jgi:membrane protein DedA with SNARE-associated domain
LGQQHERPVILAVPKALAHLIQDFRIMHHPRTTLHSVLAGLLLLAGLGPLAAAEPAPPGDVAPAAPPVAAAAAVPLGQRITADVRHEIARVQPLLDRYGYAAVGLAVAVEGFGIPAPGQTLLMAAAADAAAHARIRIGWLLLVGFLAAALGNTLGYLIGRWGGRALLRRLRVNDRHLQRVEAGFARWGGWLIVMARFFDGPRQLNGIAAGILEMPWLRFTLFNLLGAALWVGFWGIGIYFLDEHLAAIAALVHRLNPWVLAATLTVVLAFSLLAWRQFARQRDAGDAP